MESITEHTAALEKLVAALDAHFLMKPITLAEKPKQRLMTLHEYLRQVYCIDYPTRQLYDDPRQLLQKAGTSHALEFAKAVPDTPDLPELDIWVTETIAEKTKKPNEAIASFHSRIEDWVLEKMIVEESRVRCKQCGKLFRDPDCTSKHLYRRHADILKPKAKEIRDEIFNTSFVEDPNFYWLTVRFESATPRADKPLPPIPEDYKDLDDPALHNPMFMPKATPKVTVPEPITTIEPVIAPVEITTFAGRRLVDYSNI